MERFKRFRFRFRWFLCKKGFSGLQYSLTGKDSSGFGSWKTVPAVPVSGSGFGKNGSDGSGFRFRFGSWATLKKQPRRHLDSVFTPAIGRPRALSGPLNRLNAILSLLHSVSTAIGPALRQGARLQGPILLSLLLSVDCYRTRSATGSAIARPYLALSRIHLLSLRRLPDS